LVGLEFRRQLDSRSSSRDELENKCYQREYEQDVNESPHGIAAHHAKQPQNKQDYKNRPKHIVTYLSFTFTEY
jgi:hypothetical protein